jgi:prepilin peptidase CpaA
VVAAVVVVAAAAAALSAASKTSRLEFKEQEKRRRRKRKQRDMQGLTLPLTATVLSASAWAVREDLLAHRIPNRLTGCALAAGFLLQLAQSGWAGLSTACLGTLVGLAMLLPFYVVRAMGAGDVKLLAALGASLGPTGALTAGIWTLLAGGALAIGYVVTGAAHAATQPVGLTFPERMVFAFERARLLRRERFPFALAIACGALGALLERGDIQSAWNALLGARI